MKNSGVTLEVELMHFDILKDNNPVMSNLEFQYLSVNGFIVT